MIIKSAIFFLRIVDFVWDGYDHVAHLAKKMIVKKESGRPATSIPKPSYSVAAK